MLNIKRSSLDERFPTTSFDGGEEFVKKKILYNDKDIEQHHYQWWGGGNIVITRSELDELLRGNAIGWDDGEYSHVIVLE
ncbi:hypothetical protein Q7V72_03375 [Streptococcus suis]|nr:hypothetical protein [Streptococcus suis]HEM3878448.1 hypothetical protein [Streptococcus suis]HEM3895683.1 hypothetical protein [Streptococcus suis]HEM3903852.1 hypothetical protein [Streptococcus suis]